MFLRNRNSVIILLLTAAIIAAIVFFVYRFVYSASDRSGVNEPEYAGNPIIWADVPDPSVIRVGDEYYMSSTTMHMMPGTPIMRSTDLVNWEIVGYPYDRLEENDTYAMRGGVNAYGEGSWASSLRYHDDTFYVLFSALDTGKTYLFSAKDPAGSWERTEFPAYMHDPSLLFDDDGKAYIIHGRTDLAISELSADYRSINHTGMNKTIITSGKDGLEGAHAYKINDKYYIAAIWWEQGNIRRQYIYRADRIDGPYEERLVLSDTMGFKNNGVAQGGLVDTPDGEWYAMLFQDHDAVGRVPVLVPVRWEDEWPVYGDEEGKVPLEFVKPGTSSFMTELVKSDDFYQDGVIEEEPDPLSTEDTGPELATNFDFEEGTSGWKARDSEIAIMTEDGEQVVHITNRRHTGSGIEQSFSWRLSPGQRYKAAFRIKYSDGPESKEFILTAHKVDDGQTSYQNLISGVAGKGEWTVITGTFTLDGDFDSIGLFLETPWVEAPDSHADTMDFFVDYISVRAYQPSFADSGEAAPNGSRLGLTWQWNHNPDNTKWSLTERKGYLRLRTANVAENIDQARNTLTQRTHGPYSSGWISLDTRRMMQGDYAGLAAFQQEYGFIGVTRHNGQSYIVMTEKGEEQARTELLQDQVYLKIDMDFTVDKAAFFYSYDGSSWTPFGTELAMRYTLPHFMGYRFAIFNYATEQTDGYVDVDYFRFADELTGLTTPPEWTAYLVGDEIVLGSDPDITYDVPILINQYPADENIGQIRFTLGIPEEIEVVDILPNDHNLSATDIEISPLEGGLEVRMLPSGQPSIIYENTDGSRGLTVIRLKVKQELDQSFYGEATLQTMDIHYNDNRKEAYDVSGANAKFNRIQPADAVGKLPPNGNPLVSHKFGADPYALVYDGRVYLYMTNDVLEFDEAGNVKDNTYGTINKISVISSDDLMNWTDHGEIPVAGPEGAAKWATQSWAPAIAHKVIDGNEKFFLYFANNASHIGVLTSDSPVGPWVDPIGRPLIERSTPGVEGVHWLFDPAVLVDDDGQGYIYFGGGVPEDRYERPMTSRVMQLGEDMISVVGEAVQIDAPFMFEDNGIHKYNGVYYYTYCSNFYSGERPEGSPGAGEIVYMTSESPMGPWKYKGSILKNPSHFFGVGGNNHHAIFEFEDDWYITYHAQTLSKAMGEPKGYRSTHLNQVIFNEDGSIQDITADYEGVAQLKELDPYGRVEAETFAWNAGVKTRPIADNDPNQRALTDIHSGDWIALSKVNFGDGGAVLFTASVSNVVADSFIEIRLDGIDGELIGTLPVTTAGVQSGWTELTTEAANVQGVHDLYLVFAGTPGVNLFDMDYWKFNK